MGSPKRWDPDPKDLDPPLSKMGTHDRQELVRNMGLAGGGGGGLPTEPHTPIQLGLSTLTYVLDHLLKDSQLHYQHLKVIYDGWSQAGCL